MIKNLIKIIFNITIVIFVTILLFELSYRYYIIDFYKDSWIALNKNQNFDKKNADVLVFGDSFSAANSSYVSLLQNHYPNKTILNASVSGIGINEHRIFAKNRMQKNTPKTIIYQVYVGNDLLDVSHLTNWKNLSFIRNAYWTISDYLVSVAYINRKLSFLKQPHKDSDERIKIEGEFDHRNYTLRQKTLFKADPRYLEKTVTLTEDFLEKYEQWKDKMELFLDEIPSNSSVKIVFIPHCIQLNSYYQSNMRMIGANMNTLDNLKNEEYIFYKKTKEDFKRYKNVTVLNPLPFLKQKDTITKRLYYANDPHFNTDGHKALFEFLNDKIF